MKIVDRTTKYYLDNNEKYGPGSPLNLWKNEERQIQRFNQFPKIFDFTNKSLVDIGCGYGDFFLWLLDKGICLKKYIGIDLLEEHCSVANSQLPSNCTIIKGDFLDEEIEKADYYILSGTLNYYDEEWLKMSELIIKKMWNNAKIGIAFNIRSPSSIEGEYPGKKKQVSDLAPYRWCEFAYRHTNKFKLLHDYLSYDYTIAMWKTK